jgi:hypothetical protein
LNKRLTREVGGQQFASTYRQLWPSRPKKHGQNLTLAAQVGQQYFGDDSATPWITPVSRASQSFQLKDVNKRPKSAQKRCVMIQYPPTGFLREMPKV